MYTMSIIALTSSCTLSSCSFSNFELRVRSWRRPFRRFMMQSAVVQTSMGIKLCRLISWYTSEPHWSHAYVAMVSMGLTAVQLITTPSIVTSAPTCFASTWRMARTLAVLGGLKRTW